MEQDTGEEDEWVTQIYNNATDTRQKHKGYEMVTVTHTNVLSRDFPNKQPHYSETADYTMLTHNKLELLQPEFKNIYFTGRNLDKSIEKFWWYLICSVLPFDLLGPSVQLDQ